MSELKPPPGLRAPGKRLWASVLGSYVLTPTELETLRQACGTADEVNRLEKPSRRSTTSLLRAQPAKKRATRCLPSCVHTGSCSTGS